MVRGFLGKDDEVKVVLCCIVDVCGLGWVVE